MRPEDRHGCLLACPGTPRLETHWRPPVPALVPAGRARLGGAHEPPRHQLDRRPPGTPVRFGATDPNRKCRRGFPEAIQPIRTGYEWDTARGVDCGVTLPE